MQVLREQEPRLLKPKVDLLEFDWLSRIRRIYFRDEMGRTMRAQCSEEICLVNRVVALCKKARQVEAAGAM